MYVITAGLLICAVNGLQALVRGKLSTKTKMNAVQCGSGDILLRALRGEDVERTPVWLMRQVLLFVIGCAQRIQRKPASLTQAGRYIADFRAYSDKYSFRQRSETPEIAVELSLQPWRKFGVDGVIMFSGTVAKHLACMFEIIISRHPNQIY
jgi:uroporphyrinogen decarboxylase